MKRAGMLLVAAVMCIAVIATPGGAEAAGERGAARFGTNAAAQVGVTVAAKKKAPRVSLARPTYRKSSVVFSGKAPARALVQIQVRGAHRWTTVKRARAARSGAYRAITKYPSSARHFRAVVGSRVSTARVVAPPKVSPPKPAPSDACGSRPAKSTGGYWSCTFADDFGSGTLDPAKWLVQETSYSGMTGGHDSCYVNSPENIAIADGVLRLTSRQNLEPFTCVSPYGSFTSTATAATVATRSRFTQTYGRYAARLKFPREKGLAGSHSAFWLFPQEMTYGAWPASGEIDVAEWFSALPAKVYPSAHYPGENTLLSSGYNCSMPTSSTAFHEYAVEWTPSSMKFYYDNKLCFTHAWSALGLKKPQPFDMPFYVVLTQVWGLGWNAPGTTMPDSSTFEVDWVRAWS